jgi:hypothetical protein
LAGERERERERGRERERSNKELAVMGIVGRRVKINYQFTTRKAIIGTHSQKTNRLLIFENLRSL